jgi:L-fucose mutarotase
MLKYDLIHPPLLRALAAAGHGSKILIADGNYPFSTASPPGAELVHLNLTPGILTVNQVLEVVLSAINAEAATVMHPGVDAKVEAHDDYRRILGEDVPFDSVDRYGFYENARSEDVALVVATADQRLYANLLLTIGLR